MQSKYWVTLTGEFWYATAELACCQRERSMAGMFSPVDYHWMKLAARLGARGIGCVEPNPPVGCVIVKESLENVLQHSVSDKQQPTDDFTPEQGEILGLGHHRRFGGSHAEVEALQAAGYSARGATVYVTLEPCNHQGKTPACTRTLIRAGVRRVVIARKDPHPQAGGGAEELRKAGIQVDFLPGCREAQLLAAPFVTRVTEKRAWTVVKWAQTIDGRSATRSGESQWISGERSRRLVHRWRGRVDAIMTARGTVEKDDPMLTARGVHIRRRALRVVVDSGLSISPECKLVRTAAEYPLLILTKEETLRENSGRAEKLIRAGTEIKGLPGGVGGVDIKEALSFLAKEKNVTRVMVEAGPGLTGTLAEQNLIDEARVFIAPILLADDRAKPVAGGLVRQRLIDANRFELINSRTVGDDLLVIYTRR